MSKVLKKMPKSVKQTLSKTAEEESASKDELFYTIAMYWSEKQQTFEKQIKVMK